MALATAVLTFVSLAFNFVTRETKLTITDYKLSDWFDDLGTKQKANDALPDGVKKIHDLGGWQAARVFLIITLVLVAIVAVALVIRFFMRHKTLDLLTVIMGALCIVSAAAFVIAMFVGCNALTIKDTVTYLANLGVYAVAVCALATGVLAALAARKK